jgi:hypothetical protein
VSSIARKSRVGDFNICIVFIIQGYTSRKANDRRGHGIKPCASLGEQGKNRQQCVTAHTCIGSPYASLLSISRPTLEESGLHTSTSIYARPIIRNTIERIPGNCDPYTLPHRAICTSDHPQGQTMRLDNDSRRGCEVQNASNIVDFPRPSSRRIRALPQQRGSSS